MTYNGNIDNRIEDADNLWWYKDLLNLSTSWEKDELITFAWSLDESSLLKPFLPIIEKERNNIQQWASDLTEPEQEIIVRLYETEHWLETIESLWSIWSHFDALYNELSSMLMKDSFFQKYKDKLDLDRIYTGLEEWIDWLHKNFLNLNSFPNALDFPWFIHESIMWKLDWKEKIAYKTFAKWRVNKILWEYLWDRKKSKAFYVLLDLSRQKVSLKWNSLETKSYSFWWFTKLEKNEIDLYFPWIDYEYELNKKYGLYDTEIRARDIQHILSSAYLRSDMDKDQIFNTAYIDWSFQNVSDAWYEIMIDYSTDFKKDHHGNLLILSNNILLNKKDVSGKYQVFSYANFLNKKSWEDFSEASFVTMQEDAYAKFNSEYTNKSIEKKNKSLLEKVDDGDNIINKEEFKKVFWRSKLSSSKKREDFLESLEWKKDGSLFRSFLQLLFQQKHAQSYKYTKYNKSILDKKHHSDLDDLVTYFEWSVEDDSSLLTINETKITLLDIEWEIWLVHELVETSLDALLKNIKEWWLMHRIWTYLKNTMLYGWHGWLLVAEQELTAEEWIQVEKYKDIFGTKEVVENWEGELEIRFTWWLLQNLHNLKWVHKDLHLQYIEKVRADEDKLIRIQHYQWKDLQEQESYLVYLATRYSSDILMTFWEQFVQTVVALREYLKQTKPNSESYAIISWVYLESEDQVESQTWERTESVEKIQAACPDASVREQFMWGWISIHADLSHDDITTIRNIKNLNRPYTKSTTKVGNAWVIVEVKEEIPWLTDAEIQIKFKKILVPWIWIRFVDMIDIKEPPQDVLNQWEKRVFDPHIQQDKDWILRPSWQTVCVAREQKQWIEYQSIQEYRKWDQEWKLIDAKDMKARQLTETAAVEQFKNHPAMDLYQNIWNTLNEWLFPLAQLAKWKPTPEVVSMAKDQILWFMQNNYWSLLSQAQTLKWYISEMEWLLWTWLSTSAGTEMRNYIKWMTILVDMIIPKNLTSVNDVKKANLYKIFESLLSWEFSDNTLKSWFITNWLPLLWAIVLAVALASTGVWWLIWAWILWWLWWAIWYRLTAATIGEIAPEYAIKTDIEKYLDGQMTWKEFIKHFWSDWIWWSMWTIWFGHASKILKTRFNVLQTQQPNHWFVKMVSKKQNFFWWISDESLGRVAKSYGQRFRHEFWDELKDTSVELLLWDYLWWCYTLSKALRIKKWKIWHYEFSGQWNARVMNLAYDWQPKDFDMHMESIWWSYNKQSQQREIGSWRWTVSISVMYSWVENNGWIETDADKISYIQGISSTINVEQATESLNTLSSILEVDPSMEVQQALDQKMEEISYWTYNLIVNESWPIRWLVDAMRNFHNSLISWFSSFSSKYSVEVITLSWDRVWTSAGMFNIPCWLTLKWKKYTSLQKIKTLDDLQIWVQAYPDLQNITDFDGWSIQFNDFVTQVQSKISQWYWKFELDVWMMSKYSSPALLYAPVRNKIIKLARKSHFSKHESYNPWFSIWDKVLIPRSGTQVKTEAEVFEVVWDELKVKRTENDWEVWKQIKMTEIEKVWWFDKNEHVSWTSSLDYWKPSSTNWEVIQDGKLEQQENDSLISSWHTDEWINYKPLNEDRLVSDPDNWVFAAIDGMGWYEWWDIAAQIIAEEIKNAPNDIRWAIKKAQKRMKKEISNKDAWACFMYTKVLNEWGSSYLDYAYAWDCKLVVFDKNGKVKHISVDESLPPPNENVVTNSISWKQWSVTVWQRIKLDPGDKFVIWSDWFSENYGEPYGLETDLLWKHISWKSPSDAVDVISDHTAKKMEDRTGKPDNRCVQIVEIKWPENNKKWKESSEVAQEKGTQDSTTNILDKDFMDVELGSKKWFELYEAIAQDHKQKRNDQYYSYEKVYESNFKVWIDLAKQTWISELAGNYNLPWGISYDKLHMLCMMYNNESSTSHVWKKIRKDMKKIFDWLMLQNWDLTILNDIDSTKYPLVLQWVANWISSKDIAFFTKTWSNLTEEQKENHNKKMLKVSEKYNITNLLVWSPHTMWLIEKKFGQTNQELSGESLHSLNNKFDNLNQWSTIALYWANNEVYMFQKQKDWSISLVFEFSDSSAWSDRSERKWTLIDNNGFSFELEDWTSIDLQNSWVFTVPEFWLWENVTESDARNMMNHYENEYYMQLTQDSDYHSAKVVMDNYWKGENISDSVLNYARNEIAKFLRNKRLYGILLWLVWWSLLDDDEDELSDEDIALDSKQEIESKEEKVEEEKTEEEIKERKKKKKKSSSKEKKTNDLVSKRFDFLNMDISVQMKKISRTEAIRKYWATPAVRNFNPWNLQDTKFWWKRISSERFTRFSSPWEWVIALIAKIVNIQQGNSKMYGAYDTISEYISTYAPPHENNTTQYINNFSLELWVSPDAFIADLNPLDMVFAHAKFEDLQSYNMLQDLWLKSKTVKLS